MSSVGAAGSRGGRQTVEVGPGGNEYVYSSELPENGGVITSLMDVYNNNIWLVEAIENSLLRCPVNR